jgi:hypothetical protein
MTFAIKKEFLQKIEKIQNGGFFYLLNNFQNSNFSIPFLFLRVREKRKYDETLRR